MIQTSTSNRESENLLLSRNLSSRSHTRSYQSIEEAGETEPVVTPLPKLQLLIVSIVLLSEPLTSTILLPFIYFMLKDMKVSDDEKEIGSYAGWITSIFFVAQFFTAIAWGKISDRYGRRPALLCGLVGNAVSSCMFGLSKSLWWAIGSRALCGIMNGNNGVARSFLSEITDNTNKARAFSMFGFCWGMGMIASPAIGGYLNHPVTNFPKLFGWSQFLKDYPYFLPCFVSALLTSFGFIVAFFFLEESNPNVLNNKSSEEQTTLLSKDDDPTQPTGLRRITKTTLLVIAGYVQFAFYSMIFEEVLPLYFTAPSYAGGLGVTSTEFAGALAVMGISQLVFQFAIYPAVAKRFSILSLVRFALVFCVPLFFVFPGLTSFKIWILEHAPDEATGKNLFKLGYGTLLLIRYFGNCLIFTSFSIMVSTSTDPEILGTVNGFNQSCASLVRAIAPTLGGSLWSYSLRKDRVYPFDYHLVYYIITILAFINLIQTVFIPKRVSIGGRSK
ncbi:major facilitator superfamily domain-containing protein [Sporodiniella umbellata]|nr:major facilitator superfamily domain-containing protein [Sporodiniella umbellata]